jgi:hypothetical protein
MPVTGAEKSGDKPSDSEMDGADEGQVEAGVWKKHKNKNQVHDTKNIRWALAPCV